MYYASKRLDDYVLAAGTHHGHDAGDHGLLVGLRLEVLQDEVVAAVLQQLLPEVLGRVQVLAGRVLALALALIEDGGMKILIYCIGIER